MDNNNPLLDSLTTALAPSLGAALAPLVLEQVRAALREELGAKRDPSALVAKADAAHALGVSVATIDRLTRQGLPHEIIGTRRRFHVATCREWLSSRGSRPTTPERSSVREPDVDLGDIVARAGLRVGRAQ